MYSHKKHKFDDPKGVGRRYGGAARSNIKWVYNFDPLKKWIAIVMSAIIFAYGFFLIKNKSKNSEQDNILQKERVDNIKISENSNEGNNELKALQGILKSVQEQQKGIIGSGAESKYIKYGNNILLPVVINNAGKTIQVNMMLDTGCSITLLDEEVSNRLTINYS